MESFFRYIAYANYYKEEEKIGNVGFLKWKCTDFQHDIEINLRNISSENRYCHICEITSGMILGTLNVEQEMGYFQKSFWGKQDRGRTYIECENGNLYLDIVQGFEIILENGKKIEIPVYLENYQKEKKKDVTESVFYENHKDCKTEIEIQDFEEDETIAEQRKEIEKKESVIYAEEEIEDTNGKENIKSEIWDEQDEMKIMKPIYEDKWKQLCTQYPQVHPFADDKIFLSIKPKDFIILQEEYQKLVHNSFLLHGFYNYGHMILGKLSMEEKAPIYIGVPGVYYEREKQAARMFGFVGFESTTNPIKQGSYGYYMIKVEI